MSWYYRVRAAIDAAAPFLAPTQQINLALLVSAVLKKRTLCLSELARAYPTPKERRVDAPKHCLLHRLKRLWRFTDNERVDALAVQVAFIPHTVARLGYPRLVGVAIDWTQGSTLRFPLESGCVTRSCAYSRPEEGACAAAIAAFLRPGPPTTRAESEPVGAGCPLGRHRGAPRGREAGGPGGSWVPEGGIPYLA